MDTSFNDSSSSDGSITFPTVYPDGSNNDSRTESERKSHDDSAQDDAPVYQYADVDDAIRQCFPNDIKALHSTVLDIIVIYLKGQKILYTEAKTVCEQRLAYLMLPAIFFTAVCSILTLVLDSFTYGKIIVSSLGGVTTFFLALVNYLKLDARAEAHKTSAYKFDKLQSLVEFSSGRTLFTGDGDLSRLEAMMEKIQEIVVDIKETNQFILPEVIRYSYPILYTTNVFSEVKKIQTKEVLYKDELKDILNAIVKHQNHPDKLAYEILVRRKEDMMKKIISINDEFLLIDGKFTQELNKNQKPYEERKCARLCCLCDENFFKV